MSFALKCVPKTFQTLMSQIVWRNYINKFSIAYLNYIIIYSKSWTEHIQYVNLVLEKLEIHGLTCYFDKCFFGQTYLKYLGHKYSLQQTIFVWVAPTQIYHRICRHTWIQKIGSIHILLHTILPIWPPPTPMPHSITYISAIFLPT